MNSLEEISHTIVILNNAGLNSFLNGDFDHAREMLRSAYTLFDNFRRTCPAGKHLSSPLPVVLTNTEYSHSIAARPSLQFTGHDSSEVGDFCSHDHLAISSSSTNATMMDCEMDRIVQEKSKQALHGRNASAGCFPSSVPSTAHSMYNRALVLSLESPKDLSLLVQNQHRTGAIILYNLALVYHNIGIHLGLSSALPRALQLYELALESIDQGTNLIDVQKLLMAILNNCGNIYTHFHHVEESHRCFEHLRIVLAASTYDATFDDDYNFFFLNALFQCKELCFAPAA
jgi:hypothetical protein